MIRAFESGRDRKSAIEFPQPGTLQGPNEARQDGLREADQLIAMNAGVVLQALVRSDAHLSTQSVVLRIYGRTDYRRESRVNQCLPANDDEYSLLSWISRTWLSDQVKLAPLHGNC
jgi:hypothetical protein